MSKKTLLSAAVIASASIAQANAEPTHTVSNVFVEENITTKLNIKLQSMLLTMDDENSVQQGIHTKKPQQQIHEKKPNSTI